MIAIENARLFEELERRNHELGEALEQQTVLSDVLRIIAGSPADFGRVLEALGRAAHTLGEAEGVAVQLRDGDHLMTADSADGVLGWGGARVPIIRSTFSGRALLERRVVHVPDLDEMDESFAEGKAMARLQQAAKVWRSGVFAPLYRGTEAVGVLLITRSVPRPFTERQIGLFETFADQAVIAIENARLFQEFEQRNRELGEALEQQTATAEILRAIARSPTDVQPVLEAVAESAARLFEAWLVNVFRIENGMLRIVAARGPHAPGVQNMTVPFDPGHVTGRAILERRTIHIPDIRDVPEGEYPISRPLSGQFGWRTLITAPFLAEGVPVGAISLNRQDARPFTDREVELVQSFADQAAIAIQNARLFQDLEQRKTT